MKSMAEIHPLEGEMMPHFELISAEGERVNVSDFRGHRNLVVAFVDGPDCAACMRFLSELAERHREFEEDEAEVLAVVRGSIDEAREARSKGGLPFAVLADEGGRIHREIGGPPTEGSGLAVYVTDRYGEVYWGYRTGSEHELPPAGEALSWLRLIESECPECGVSEWPA